MPLVDTVVANSHAGKAFTHRTTRLPDSRVEVVHNGVDTARFQPLPAAGAVFRERIGVPRNALLVGMVGSYKRQKGHGVFLRMAARLAARFPNVFFLLVGCPTGGDLTPSYAYKAEIKDLAAELCLQERCRFIETEPDMPAVYNACDVTVLLSRREGTPNVLLESMACGIPVVASDVADNSLLISDGKTGHIVGPEDHVAAARHVVRLLSEPEERRRMGEGARARVCADFSLQIASQKLERIYCDRLATRRTGSAVSK
jgi:glycosyltransferase involved in cell wall biosynthesis